MERPKLFGWFLFLSGHVALGAGIVGIFVPLLPTTPFIILAAYCFSRSSPRMEAWLLRQKRLGPLLRNWREHRAISTRAKIMASACIALVFGTTLFLGEWRWPVQAVFLATGAGVLGFIWTRPNRPR